jgi:hypothetical protein
MKKFLTLFLVLGLVAGAMSMPAHAKSKKKVKKPVVETATYSAPAAGASDAGGGCLGAAGDCVTFAGPTGNVSIEIDDAAGGPVAASVSWDSDGDGIDDQNFSICGKTDKPLSVPVGVKLDVFAWAAPSSVCPTGHATTGTVKATFTF